MCVGVLKGVVGGGVEMRVLGGGGGILIKGIY